MWKARAPPLTGATPQHGGARGLPPTPSLGAGPLTQRGPRDARPAGSRAAPRAPRRIPGVHREPAASRLPAAARSRPGRPSVPARLRAGAAAAPPPRDAPQEAAAAGGGQQEGGPEEEGEDHRGEAGGPRPAVPRGSGRPSPAPRSASGPGLRAASAAHRAGKRSRGRNAGRRCRMGAQGCECVRVRELRCGYEGRALRGAGCYLRSPRPGCSRAVSRSRPRRAVRSCVGAAASESRAAPCEVWIWELRVRYCFSVSDLGSSDVGKLCFLKKKPHKTVRLKGKTFALVIDNNA